MSVAAFSLAVIVLIFLMDFASGIDPKIAKKQGKAAVKKGNTFVSGLAITETETERAMGTVLGSVALLAVGVAMTPLLRSRRLGKNSKLWICLVGFAIGLVMVVPVRALLLMVSRLIL
ncbi:MAG: hypothetical protein ABR507_04690 [Actinomycetota bacterium]